MTTKRYPTYVPQTAEWFTEVPLGWEVKPLKAVAKALPGGTPDTENQDFWGDSNSGVAWAAISDMSSSDSVFSTKRSLTSAGLASTRLTVGEPGTVLFAMYASVGEVSQLAIRSAWNQALLGLVPRDGVVTARYLFYALKNSRGQLPFLYRSNTQNNLNAQQVAGIKIPVPPLDVQQQIADYLDEQAAKVDLLIEKQERLIATLAERRQAVISLTVTKGLSATSPMKDSHVRWVGSVPIHWGVGNIRRFASMRTGHTPSRSHPEYWQDCTIPWFTLADVWQLRGGRKYLGDTAGSISAVGLSNSAAELLPEGTVVLSRTASVGFTGIMPIQMATSQDYWNWVCGPDMKPEFLWYQFYAMRPYFASLVQGSTHKTIYQADAAAMSITAPPLHEQAQIIEYLDRETAHTDALAAKAREMIDVLKERRQALISAAVTGKIDVRGLS